MNSVSVLCFDPVFHWGQKLFCMLKSTVLARTGSSSGGKQFLI